MRPDPVVDSVADQPPFFGPDQPVYPLVDQLCRITGPALIGTSVYPAFNTQTVIANGRPTPRDREPVYVWAVNGEALGPGYYLCRLVNFFGGLPLLATYCCQGPAPTSASSSSSGSSSFR